VKAEGCDFLVHEATFENELREDAVLKKHCTVSEALQIGKKAKAKNIILTHFSQRYPRIQDDSVAVGEKDASKIGAESNIVYAFDGLVLNRKDIGVAASTMDSMRKYYDFKEREKEKSKIAPDDVGKVSLTSKEILNTPGLFAVEGVLH